MKKPENEIDLPFRMQKPENEKPENESDK